MDRPTLHLFTPHVRDLVYGVDFIMLSHFELLECDDVQASVLLECDVQAIVLAQYSF